MVNTFFKDLNYKNDDCEKKFSIFFLSRIRKTDEKPYIKYSLSFITNYQNKDVIIHTAKKHHSQSSKYLK